MIFYQAYLDFKKVLFQEKKVTREILLKNKKLNLKSRNLSE